MTRADAVVARARACVGARFRLQGREPAFGLDCVGLVAWAIERAAPAGYGLRGSGGQVGARFEQAGLVQIDPAQADGGDVLVVVPGPAQLHLIVLTDGGFVHAHAGLRRIVATPGAPLWPITSAWHLEETL